MDFCVALRSDTARLRPLEAVGRVVDLPATPGPPGVAVWFAVAELLGKRGKPYHFVRLRIKSQCVPLRN